MASSTSDFLSEPAIIEQIITEFFAKSLHIILESRSPYVSSRNYSTELFTTSPSSLPSSPKPRPRDKWFNLALRDCPAALENFDLWRQSNLEPLVVDVILARRGSKDPPPNSWSSGHDGFFSDNKSEKAIERWVVQYESRESNNIPIEPHLCAKESGSGGSCSSALSKIPSMYRKTNEGTILLLRSLYATVRLLPAYKVFRDLNSSRQICSFSLSHKISSFGVPFTHAEDAEMSRFNFAPVETPCGKLSLSVSYIPALDDVNLDASTPMSAQFIPDYVGSPTTDPLKTLQYLPSAASLPAYISFARRPSWSNDHGAPSVSLSPSPTYSDSRAGHYTSSHRLPPQSNPLDHTSSTRSNMHNLSPLAHEKNTSFDEYWPSPSFSPSSSPSPPSNLPLQVCNSLLRSESAPVSIPLPRLRTNSGLTGQGMSPSPSPRCMRVVCSLQTDLLRAQATGASVSQTSPESKLQQKKGSGELHTVMTLQKISYSPKDELGNLSGQKLSSCPSPRIPSRSSSRFSFLDEFDDSEFACPFAEDYEDPRDSCKVQPAVADDKAGENLVCGGLTPVRSPDALVGALVRMLKTAAPLRQDPSHSVTSVQVMKEQAWDRGVQRNKGKEVGADKLDAASGICKSRTAADGLEELKSYKEMKELLLRQGGFLSLDSDLAKNIDQKESD